MRKVTVGISAIALCLLAVPAGAEITGTVTVTSEYVLRGVSQTNEEPAIQGEIVYAGSTGFYVGTWGSSINLEHIGLPQEAQVELDLFAGWAWEAENGFGLDLGVIHYDYPGASEINYEEIYFGLSFKWLSVTYYYADDFLGLGGEGHYVDSALSFELPAGFSLGFHAGFNSFADEVGILDYVDYKASVAKAFGQLSLEVAYSNTDENQLGNHDDDRVIVSLSVTDMISPLVSE